MEKQQGGDSTTTPGALVLKTNQHDVILGRGKNASRRPGNVTFRAMAAQVVEAYHASMADQKNALAEDIFTKIQQRGGRFLQPVTASNAKGQLVAAWEVVDSATALAKVKQAIRDTATMARRRAVRAPAPPAEGLADVAAATLGGRTEQRT